MAEFTLDLDEIDRDVALLKLTDAAGVSLEKLPEKLAAMAARIRALNVELQGASERAQLVHEAVERLKVESGAQKALLKEARQLCAAYAPMEKNGGRHAALLAKLDEVLKP